MLMIGTVVDGHGQVVTVRVSRSARKHRIGDARILSAMQSAGEPVPLEGDAWLYVGNDPKTNRPLKVIAVRDDRGKSNLTVIHCSPLEWHGDGGERDDRDG
jgi:hypothetical protein